MSKRWVETGRGEKGSIFVSEKGEVCKAKKTGKTRNGIPQWELTYAFVSPNHPKTKIVYARSKRELKRLL